MYHFNKSTFHRNHLDAAHYVVLPPAFRSNTFRTNTWRKKTFEEIDNINEAPGIFRTVSMTDTEDLLEIKRTGSGGLFVRNRSDEVTEDASRGQANQLCSLYEITNVRDIDLNSNSRLAAKPKQVTVEQSLGTISAMKGAEAFKNQEMMLKEKTHHDSLLMGKELTYQNRMEEQIKCNQKRERRAENVSDRPMFLSPEQNYDVNVGVEVALRKTPIGPSRLFMRKRSKREEISRAKAHQMCSMFELSDVRDVELNKEATIIHRPIKLAAPPSLTLSNAKKAVNVFKKQEAKRRDRNKRADPLQTERQQRTRSELVEQKRRQERPQKQEEKQGHSSSSMMRRPLAHLQESSGDIGRVHTAFTKHRTIKSQRLSRPVMDGVSNTEVEVTLAETCLSLTFHNLPTVC